MEAVYAEKHIHALVQREGLLRAPHHSVTKDLAFSFSFHSPGQRPGFAFLDLTGGTVLAQPCGAAQQQNMKGPKGSNKSPP